MAMTYADFMRTIEANALAIPGVESFHYSNYAISSESNIKYAAVSVYPMDSAQVVNGPDLQFSFKMIYADRLTSDRCNTIEVQSVAVQVLSELLNVIKAADNSVRVSGWSLSMFNEGFADLCAGAVATVSVSFQNDLGNCYFIDPHKLCEK